MINTVTLNPAMDKIIKVKSFNLNCMNRIQETIECIGGKGTHLAYNLSMMGVENRTFGISFGHTGKEIIRLLEQRGVETEYIWREQPESRTNYLLIDDEKNCTFIAETGNMLNADITDEMLTLIIKKVHKNDVLIIAGDASNVEDADIQKKLLDIAQDFHMKLYLDSSGEFMKNGIRCSPYFIKPNMEEWSELVGRDVKTAEQVVETIDFCADIPMVMVSMGAAGWVFRLEDKIYRGFGLEVPVENTAGCGDALLSALVYKFEYSDEPMLDKLAFATAASAACAMTELTVGVDMNIVKKLMKKVRIEEVSR